MNKTIPLVMNHLYSSALIKRIVVIAICLAGLMTNPTKGQKRANCYILSGYVFDIENPDYVICCERLLINSDTIYTDSNGHYEYIVPMLSRHVAGQSFKDMFLTNKQSPNKKHLLIKVGNQEFEFKNPWKKMVKEDSLRQLTINIGIEARVPDQSHKHIYNIDKKGDRVIR